MLCLRDAGGGARFEAGSGDWRCVAGSAPSEWTQVWFDDGKWARAAAVARVSVLGLYELRINGRKAGEEQLTPGWTDCALKAWLDMDITLANGAQWCLVPGAGVT